ncbi:MAG TPA: SHOCT domain-containing protein [Allosphingosinicella sp.]|nr:SHOCT domain-containing protein [Allosphingosinicella sp.]
MRLTGGGDRLKVNALGCIILPASLFIGLMLATAGVAVWPRLAAPGAAILCGGGDVVYQSHGASYRPGEYTITREIFCQSGPEKAATREEITLGAMGVSFLIYAFAAFLLLQFAVRPLVARRVRRRMAMLGLGTPERPTWSGPQPPPTGLRDIFARVEEAMRRGEADVQVRNVSIDLTGQQEAGGDIAARLAQLKALRDQGLITAQDYEAKKAEILAGL